MAYGEDYPGGQSAQYPYQGRPLICSGGLTTWFMDGQATLWDTCLPAGFTASCGWILADKQMLLP